MKGDQSTLSQSGAVQLFIHQSGQEVRSQIHNQQFWLLHMKTFLQRWKVALIFMGIIYFLATIGVWVAVFVPFVGGPLFLAGLMIWYVPGLLFHWTRYFVWHEFGAAPAGWQGHLVMFLFYLGVAVLVSLLFRRIWKK